MRDTKDNILVYLPSPMGDGILCIPALRAIRRHFKSSQISFFANQVVREILSPNNFNDVWLDQEQSNPLAIALMLNPKKFTHAVLFKNSFASALAVFLAGIPSRIGYARQGRGFLLTDKLYPPKLPSGKFKPRSMIDYYLQIASHLGTDTGNRTLELLTEPQCLEKLKVKLPEIFDLHRPIVILVPGGAFGLSKCWLSERFAQTADRLISNYNAAVVISVSPDPIECRIAEDICRESKNKLINLAQTPLSLGELKSLFSVAYLVITNDTGPRHIAIAFKRKLITLFGPNDPAWTETGYENEIKIEGKAHCVPCSKPECKEFEHLCMQSITVDMVCEASEKLLAPNP